MLPRRVPAADAAGEDDIMACDPVLRSSGRKVGRGSKRRGCNNGCCPLFFAPFLRLERA